jgi:hypothetical protein
VNVYVTPPAVPGAPGTGAGTEDDPFTSVADGIKAAQNGGTVYLRGGHYVESVELEAVSGVDVQRIVVQPFGDGEVFIDSLLPEFLVPGADDGWDPVTPPGETFNGEYVWRRPYPAPGTELGRQRVIGGAFLDEPVHIRLVSYSQLGDLRAENQLWPDDSPADGNQVWRPHDSLPETFIPENRRGRIHRRPWVYMGPGIWFNEAAGERQVHIRLASTNNRVPGWDDYEPNETDPNNLRLALSREEDYAIFLTNCHHITFRDLTLRFGSPDTIRLNTCTHITFDHCRIRSGTRAINLLTGNAEDSTNEDIRVEHCVIDGGIPTWVFRSDRKDEYLMGPTDKDQAVKGEVFRNRLGASTSGVQISGTKRNIGVIVHHCEIINAHDSYVFGDGMQFHHNWVHNLNDDGIALSGDAETTNARIFCNVMTQCLTALSFASEKTLGPVYVFGNLIDIRQPTLGIRPRKATGAPESLRQGQFFKDGANEGRIELFHNTCVVLDPGAAGDNLADITDAGFSNFVNNGASEPRRAFDNIMVAVYTSDSHIRPIAFLAPAEFITQSDGNTYFRIPQGAEGSINFEIRRSVGGDVVESGAYPTLADYRKAQWPPDGEGGYEAESRLEDPMFRSFDIATGRPRHGDDLRLHSESPAKGNVFTNLPVELRAMYLEATGEEPLDRGCYPSTGARLRVGVDGRRVFPRMRAGLGNGTHPDDIPPVFAP